MFLCSLSACNSQTQTSSPDRSQFDVVRQGVNIDARIIACVESPQSVGFKTSKECMDDVERLMKANN
jgi:hypothetical protein